jgi:hypothetical protein
MTMNRRMLAAAAFAACLTGSATAAEEQEERPIVLAGSDNIIPFLDQYRSLIGDNLGNKPAQKRGRREINWDGVPDDSAAPEFLPPDFFRGRGVILKTPGKGVQVSARADNPKGLLPRFGHINPSYVKTFQTFSAERLFSPIDSNIVDVTFVVAGTNTPGLVRGFGAVYVDVDRAETAFEFFDREDKSLGKYPVPQTDGGFSFLGVLFNRPIVARVRIEYGTSALGPDDGPQYDVAVMDDFIYDEPQPYQAPKAPAKKKKKY